VGARPAPLIRRSAPAREGDPEADPETLQDLLQRFLGELPPARRSLGSGFIITPNGEIVTNTHVVEGAERIRVRLSTEEELEAKVVGTDDKTDIALLRVPAPRPLPTLPLGDSDALAVGDWVLAIGNPFGLAQTATAGIVSAKGRFLGAGPYDDFIQTDASINPGNSGGPLIDQEGRVVGMNTAIVSPAGGNVGIGFAIPVNLVRWVVEQLRQHGRVVRGWIGVAVQPVTPELARSFQLPKAEGALVADLTRKSPAARAGIRRGDVIVRFGERPIRHSRELPMLVAGTPPRSRVALTVLRGGEELTLAVTVGELPAQPARTPSPSESEEWGLTLESVPPDEARRLGLPAGVGVLVLDVVEGAPAADAGLEPGDVILQVDRRRVNSPTAFWKTLGGKAQALLLVRRGSESVYLELTR
jgi:serine protease Do